MKKVIFILILMIGQMSVNARSLDQCNNFIAYCQDDKMDMRLCKDVRDICVAQNKFNITPCCTTATCITAEIRYRECINAGGRPEICRDMGSNAILIQM